MAGPDPQQDPHSILLVEGDESDRRILSELIRATGHSVVACTNSAEARKRLAVYADLTAQDPLASYRKNLYRIDGSLQLKRSRFLHLYLDLEYREISPQRSVEAGFLNANVQQIDSGAPVAESDAFGVYELKQNRQISTGKMQYFDTPFLGALVYVTSMQPE